MNRQVVLVLLAVTLFGTLSGFVVTLVKPVHYQADAYVVVYDMPRGLNDVLSPDEAAHLNDIYKAGMLQDAVVKLVQEKLPQYSAQALGQAIQVEIVAYTPFTRITATATTAEGAATLANVVADAWTTVARTANENAYDATKATLEAREDVQLQQITATQDALKAADPSSDSAKEIQKQLDSLQDELSKTAAAILDLDRARYDVVGNAYVQIFAKASDAVQDPDPVKSLAIGAGIGFSLGLLLELWITSRRRNRDGAQKSVPRPAASLSLAVGDEATHEW